MDGVSAAATYSYLNRPVERDELTEQQRAILDATETSLGIEMAFGADIPGETGEMLAWMGARGWHARVQSPFTSGDLWWAGFTPHGVSGWNGRPDHQVGDVTLRGALWRAVLLALLSGPPDADAAEIGQEPLL